MKTYGGLGGIMGGRQLDSTDRFEVAVNKALGDQIRADDKTAGAMWCALANVDWTHVDGDTASYSFRAAGDLVAAIRGSGDYIDWYCGGFLVGEDYGTDYPHVRDDIAAAMLAEGWTSTITE